MEVSTNLATVGLARVGARAALSFAFAFLKRAWYSGEDSELCTDVLQEALEILQNLPVALLFDTSIVSEVWLEVVDRSMKFLMDIQKRCHPLLALQHTVNDIHRKGFSLGIFCTNSWQQDSTGIRH